MQKHEFVGYLARKYPGVEEDHMRVMVGALRNGLIAGDYVTARGTFVDVLGYIRREGSRGKDIRFARKELNGIAKEYGRAHGHDREHEIKRQAVVRMTRSFADSLPDPKVNGRRYYATNETSEYRGEEKNEGVDNRVKTYVEGIIRNGDSSLRKEFIEQISGAGDLALFVAPNHLQLGYGALMQSVKRGVPPEVAVKAFVDVDLDLGQLEQLLYVIEQKRG